jgi:hypothetical protein
MDYLDKLKDQLWKQSIGTENRVVNRTYCERISQQILTKVDKSISWETIRDFLEGNRTTSLRSLDKISAYVLNDPNATFSDFEEKCVLESAQNQFDKQALGKTDSQNSLFKKRFWITIFIVAVSSISILSFQKLTETPKAFETRFYDSNLDSLEKDGWYLFEEYVDTSLWDNPLYQSNGYLTLETFLGDSWLANENYEPRILNILTRDLECGKCFSVKVKIVDFNPYQPYQQAGFFIFYGKNQPVPSIRNTIATGGKDVNVEAVKRFEKYKGEHLFKYKKHIKKWGWVRGQNVIPHLDSMVLELVVSEEDYFFKYKLNEESETYIGHEEIDFGQPHSIGLAAFQGRPDIPYPVRDTADIIPANFEYIKIRPMSCDE